MIVETDALGDLGGTVTMVDGGFDPLHPGHVDYFRAAAELGLPVLCNVSSDGWVARKHPPLLSQSDRGALIDAMRHIEYVHLAAGSTASVLRALAPRFYAKGIDWEGKLPAEELEACATAGVEIVFLPTVSRSSSEIVERFRGALNL